MSDNNDDKYDINGPNFDSDLYLEKLFKESTLRQIMDQESEIVKDTQTLRSVMQTLVYENYNKFISATDTIKKMKCDFKKMETEMDLLASNMESIMSSSDQISSTLHDTRQQISKLSGVHSLLKKLQFLFTLPATLKTQLDESNYEQAVHDYLHAQRVLQQYGDLPSLHGIQSDCAQILQQITTSLHNQLAVNRQQTPQFARQPSAALAIDLLLRLGEPARELCAEYLSCASVRLGEQMHELGDESDRKDVAELIDMGCDGVLGEMCTVVGGWWEMVKGVQKGDGDYELENSEIFENFAATDLETFIDSKMTKYFAIIQNKIESEAEIGDTSVLVASLDRFYRQLNAMHSLLRNVDFNSRGIEIIIIASRKQCKVHLKALKLHLNQTLAKVRQSLTAPKSSNHEENLKNVTELLNLLTLTTVEKIKGVLQDLSAFIHKNVSFAKNTQFKNSFCIDSVREGLMVCFLHHLAATCRTYCIHNATDTKVPPTLLLILSKFCLAVQNGHLHFILSQTDELFLIPAKNSSALTTEAELSGTMRESAQEMLNCFVRVQGLNISQMLRKSVETRDWLHTIEPRTVRPVMKRVVEDISDVDNIVALLYEDQDVITEHSSDSSRKTRSISTDIRHKFSGKHQYRSNWSSYTPSQLESAFVSNMHKLFSERIEIFSSVEFSKISILTGIIKISLKTFMECVRLKTFSKFGLQQIQVDIHYLQLYLWRFVADENLVHFLLDEILGSAVHRCLDPILMEPSVVDIICERG